jgi:prolyl oligopeptidase
MPLGSEVDMRNLRKIAAAAGLALALAGTTVMGQEDDPYIWLEEVHGERQLAWVREKNEAALRLLKGDPSYQTNFDALLAILDATDRIPAGTLHGQSVFNFWRDAQNVRGIWRRTTVQSYEMQNPSWEIILDLDKLAAEESKNWVWNGARCSPALNRCLISLSPGGTDAVVTREFDLAAKQFVADGFSLPEAKSDSVYVDEDTVLFATDFGPGTLTNSGYPRIVKLWRRGQPIAAARQIFEGIVEDVGSWPAVFYRPGGSTALVGRAVSFFETENYVLRPDGSTVKLPLPLSADIKGMLDDQLLFTLRQAWTPPAGQPLAQGALVAFSLNDFLARGTLPPMSVLYAPGPRGSIEDVATSRDAVFVGLYENVTGNIHAFRRNAQTGVWTNTRLALPEGGAPTVSAANDFGPEAHFSHQGFLTPTTLYAEHGAGAPAPIKSLPARFDASRHAVAQYEAVSTDGTRVPYFVVRPRNAAGPVPTILYGYGGFENSLTPWYWASAGKIWLEQGGSYVVANIRGGGEFGPAWHEAALKLNRQRAYDDFIAVAEDLHRRGITTPRQLGIMGGSNGGLLVGAVAVQRPELFAAVVCQVPLLDMIRYMQIGAGASWEGEYGDPSVPAERAAIMAYSPYQNVKRGVTYPPIFFVTATSDDRVTPVHARKMAARMMEQGHDVLFYENTDGGHAAAANNRQNAEMWALTFIYLAQKLGL